VAVSSVVPCPSLPARTHACTSCGRAADPEPTARIIGQARAHARTHARLHEHDDSPASRVSSSCRAAEQRASRATARGNVRCLSRAGGVINARLQPRPRRSGILCCHRHGNLLSLCSPSGGTACFGGGVSLDDRRRTLDLIAAVRKMVLVHTLHDRIRSSCPEKGRLPGRPPAANQRGYLTD
jgi:hypothetical protein